MQCDRAQEFFSDYLERTLDRPMTVALEAHLGGCAGCREEIEALRDAFAALEAVPEVEPPKDGAWQVTCQLRRLKADQWEAQRRQAPSFLDRLRALNPFSVAMGAGLATLVIAGTMLLPGVGEHIQNFLVGFRVGTTPVPAVAQNDAPSVMVTYGDVTPEGRKVDLTVTSQRDLPNARIQVLGENLPQTLVASGTAPRGVAIPFRLTLPERSAAEAVTVVIESPAMDRPHRSVVVLPLSAKKSGLVTLGLAGQPLSEALKQVVPYLGEPVVVDGSADAPVTIQVDGQSASAVLAELASQADANVLKAPGVHRMVPAH